MNASNNPVASPPPSCVVSMLQQASSLNTRGAEMLCQSQHHRGNNNGDDQRKAMDCFRHALEIMSYLSSISNLSMAAAGTNTSSGSFLSMHCQKAPIPVTISTNGGNRPAVHRQSCPLLFHVPTSGCETATCEIVSFGSAVIMCNYALAFQMKGTEQAHHKACKLYEHALRLLRPISSASAATTNSSFLILRGDHHQKTSSSSESDACCYSCCSLAIATALENLANVYYQLGDFPSAKQTSDARFLMDLGKLCLSEVAARQGDFAPTA